MGLSSCGHCTFLDTQGCGWWNSVGNIIAHRNGIPGFDEKIAKSEALYIYTPKGVKDSCASIHSDGQWYDKFCGEAMHFVCNAMSFSERMPPMLRSQLEQTAFNKHFHEWTGQRQLEHFKEMMEQQKQAYEDMVNNPYGNGEGSDPTEKQKQEAEHEALREKLRGQGYFEPYQQHGYFSQSMLDSKFGTDQRYSFPVQWQHRRRVMENMRSIKDIEDVKYMKCVRFEKDEICVGFDGIEIKRYMDNGTLMESGHDSQNREVTKLRMGYWMNEGRYCLMKWLCVEVESNGIVMIQPRMVNVDEKIMVFEEDQEWDEIIRHIDDDDDKKKWIEKCVWLLHVKICIESTYDNVNHVNLYRASVIM